MFKGSNKVVVLVVVKIDRAPLRLFTLCRYNIEYNRMKHYAASCAGIIVVNNIAGFRTRDQICLIRRPGFCIYLLLRSLNNVFTSDLDLLLTAAMSIDIDNLKA